MYFSIWERNTYLFLNVILLFKGFYVLLKEKHTTLSQNLSGNFPTEKNNAHGL